MFKKIVEVGVETQKKFLKGVNFIDEIIGGTLGPGGRNRLIQTKYKSPLCLNDGANIARRIVLDDPIEDLAAQTIIEVSMRTAEQAGDGTTASVVIASELVRKGMGILTKEGEKSILEGDSKINPMQMWRDIQAERDKALELLKKNSKPLKDKDLDNIVSTALENLDYGKTLGELLRKIGSDGYISVEDNWATKYGITTEITEGMKFLGTYASPYLMTSANKKEAVWQDTHILITNHKIESVSVFKDLLEEVSERGIRKLVIIGGFSEGVDPFSKEFIESISRAMLAYADLKTANRGDIIQVLAIKAPSLTSTELEDVAVFTNGAFIDKKITDLKGVRAEHLGFAKRVSATEEEVNIIGGTGDAKQRIKILKDQTELEKDIMFKEKLKRRIASLSSGVGIIKVGAQTETECSYLKYKLEDAIFSVKGAREEGFVKGGGLALKEIAQKLGKESILYSALMAPYERIQKNGGGEIPASVIDSTKVVRLSLENACSGAGMLITADGAIAEEKMDFMSYMEKAFHKLVPRDERDDWRDDENQDLGDGKVH